MIRISLYNALFHNGIQVPASDKDNVKIKIEGHALFAQNGKDIVCSAVSALGQTLILSITKIAGLEQQIEQTTGLLQTEFSVPEISSEAFLTLKVLIDSFLIGCFEIAKNYPDHVDLDFIK